MRRAPAARAASIARPGEGDHVEFAALRLQRRLGRLADQLQPLLDREQPRLVGVGADADHQPVAQRRRVRQHVEMAVGHRVEGAGIEGDAGHGDGLAGRARRGKGRGGQRCACAAPRSARGRSWKRRTPGGHMAKPLRSARWFAPDDFRAFGHRSRMSQMGYSAADYRGQASHRHRQHLVRPRPVPRPFQDARRGRQARRAAGGRLSRRTAGAVALRNPGQADHHALSQLPGDGDGGAHPLAPDRRRGADGRLRQDDARPHPGGDQRGRSRDLRSRRADAARQLARQDSGLRLGRDQILGGAARRDDLASRPGARWRTASRAPTASAW